MKGIEDQDDISQIMLELCFTMLVDYVELDKAEQLCNLDPDHKKDRPRWWHAGTWRRPDLGLKRLQAEIDIKLPDGSRSKTSEVADEIRELYMWWTQERPKRPHPFEQAYASADPKALDAAEKQWEKYVAEDQKMLSRLVAIRPKLWS